MSEITIDSLTKITPRQARQHIETTLLAGLVPYLQSSPGIGKSSIFKAIANDYRLKVIDHRLSTSAPEDLTGLPTFTKDGSAVFRPFKEIFPTEDVPVPEGFEGWLLLLDEFPSAPRSVQAAAYKLILDQEVGGQKLHSKVMIACAGNLATDRAIVNEIGTAMQSRLIHLMMREDFDEWLEDVAIINDYSPHIIGFLNAYKSKLMDFRPDHHNSTFCCPRTWEFVNKLLKVYDNKIPPSAVQLFSGTITAEVAVEFYSFIQLSKEMVTIPQIEADPSGVYVPTANDMKWATIASLSENASKENLEALVTYAKRFPFNFTVLFYRMLLKKNMAFREHKAMVDAAASLARYMNGGKI